MSRASYMSQSGGMNAAMNAIDQIKRKERQYKKTVIDNHDNIVFVSETLSKGGQFEESILDALKGGDRETKDDLMAFAEEQRSIIKKITLQNVKNMRKIDTFMAALDAVRDEAQAGGVDDAVAYEDLIPAKIEEITAQRAELTIKETQERMYLDVVSAIGEKPEGADEEDDELEVMNNVNANSLKCPISMTWYEDPVKSTICGHVYSNASITSQLRQNRGRMRCPLPGCANQNLTASQLEPDPQTKKRVNRARRREEAERELRMSQMAGVDDDSEEEEMQFPATVKEE